MKQPSQATLKRLFSVSGNRCAFPKCPLTLVDEQSGKVTGRICHIKAQSPGGARYDENQTDEEKHGFENLILMCPIHHDVIDSDEEAYTVERLHKIKAEHENTNKDGCEPNENVVNDFIALSYNFATGSQIITPNQKGGQTAHLINNFWQQFDSANSWEREIQSKREAHDLDIFRRSDVILDEESLERIIGRLYGSHAYRSKDSIAIEEFCRFYEKTGNQYLNQNINNVSSKFAAVLSELLDFIVIHFFYFPNYQNSDNPQFCLYPERNLDRGAPTAKDSEIYSKYTIKLNDLLVKTQTAYSEYRKVIKENLFI